MSTWDTKRELRDYQLRVCLYGRPRAPNGWRWGAIKGGWGRPPAPRVEVSRPIRLSEAVANRLDWPLLAGGHQTSYPTSSCVPCGSRHVKKMIEDGRRGPWVASKDLSTMHVRPYHNLPYHLHGPSLNVEKSKGANGVWGLGTPWANGGGSDACEYPSKHTRGGPDGLRGGPRPAPQPPASNSSASIRGNSWECTLTARRRMSRSNG